MVEFHVKKWVCSVSSGLDSKRLVTLEQMLGMSKTTFLAQTKFSRVNRMQGHVSERHHNYKFTENVINMFYLYNILQVK